jgi:two-component system, OmpR family, alkaline phosphatase synthesis response regulator PhoP
LEIHYGAEARGEKTIHSWKEIMKQKTILVVEDDIPILTGLVDLLEGEGYRVVKAIDGKEALRRYRAETPNLILLDIMIPEKSGYDVCREIRAGDPVTPILILTAKGQQVDKVVGLELGADDYIVKPFGADELLARIRAAFRRVNARTKKKPDDKTPIKFGRIEIDPRTLTGKRGKKTFPVTLREIEILRFMMDREGEAIHRFDFLDEIWGMSYEGTTRTLDQHIAQLRKKIEEKPEKPFHIITVHGVGYRFIS